MTSGATPKKNSPMSRSELASIHFTTAFSGRRCMKFWITSVAFTSAIPNAVIRVSHLMPNIGPTTLTTSSTSSAM